MTSANVSDVVTAHALLHGGQEQAWGDTGYQGVGKPGENRDTEVDWQIEMRAGKRRRLNKAGAQEATERRKASVPARVEHPFLHVKPHFGYAKVRYLELAKNTQGIAMLLGFSNLLIAGRYATTGGGADPSGTAARRRQTLGSFTHRPLNSPFPCRKSDIAHVQGLRDSRLVRTTRVPVAITLVQAFPNPLTSSSGMDSLDYEVL